jgi:dipeptide/tripeptide permease
LGGLPADRWLGTKVTVVIGALLMAGGHLAMTFDASSLLALLLLIAGSGCLNGNISAQVGSFYDQMSPTEFWSIDAAIGIVGGLIVLALARPLAEALEPAG